jgi:hypothetical protein
VFAEGISELARMFRRRKNKDKVKEEVSVPMTDLEELCADDKETYSALFSAMFLDPTKVGVSVKDAADTAKRKEKEKDLTGARMWYEVAGALAIYGGDVKKVAEYYGSAQRVANKEYPILKDPQKAVAKAQEYYKKHLADLK